MSKCLGCQRKKTFIKLYKEKTVIFDENGSKGRGSRRTSNKRKSNKEEARGKGTPQKKTTKRIEQEEAAAEKMAKEECNANSEARGTIVQERYLK